jgi:FdhD protein
VAVEEPLQIRVDDVLAATTMRTPGHDVELALGWLVSEGLVTRPDDIVSARACFDTVDDEDTRRVVEVTTHHRPRIGPRLQETTSACGICGGDVVALALGAGRPAVSQDRTAFDLPDVLGFPEAMHEAQRAFRASGGLHAAALFMPDGEVVCVREDVGRHNAVDKVVGWAFGAGMLPLHGYALQVSGRASAELVHKCIAAGVPLLAAVSAPSTLAIRLARAADLTLLGFVRGHGLNVYSGEGRLTGLP